MPPHSHIHIVMSARSIGLAVMASMVEEGLRGTFDIKPESPRVIREAIAEAFGKVLPLGYTWYPSSIEAPPVFGLQGQASDAGLIIHSGVTGEDDDHDAVTFSPDLGEGVAAAAMVLAYLTITST
jgi:hypothetical protein